jgi:hypothetical protein
MSPGVSVATALAASVSAATRRRTGGGSMDSTGQVSNKRSSMIQRLNGLANSRGDVSSQVAYLHAVCHARRPATHQPALHPTNMNVCPATPLQEPDPYHQS